MVPIPSAVDLFCDTPVPLQILVHTEIHGDGQRWCPYLVLLIYDVVYQCLCRDADGY